MRYDDNKWKNHTFKILPQYHKLAQNKTHVCEVHVYFCHVCDNYGAKFHFKSIQTKEIEYKYITSKDLSFITEEGYPTDINFDRKIVDCAELCIEDILE